ncbi:uncharacterized protein K444DRAFT_619406 [Hyaloscypha bicolor E]|uniref:Mid2 domain-containing protein n=1 Tax=Hyaloscypha bicolor E TaxID=1095630 RepID=A0A2J6SPJ0_9HELO|nr:uncharacterized protein K444DRAFT_619406 [Hyaloscypha bicolor E]PMD52695.1 hypothetical protein K444DRAFT_619406 [Hyaloscypha bicolor E]
MPFQITPILIAFLCHLLAADASPPCYWSDGTLAPSTIQPCNSNLPEGSYSACCSLGRTPPDVCFSSGLCLTGNSYTSNGLIFANGCTDPTGKDPSCQQYCTNRSTEFYILDPCEDGRWCCQTDGALSSCCKNGQGSFTLLPGTIMFPSAATSGGQSPTQITTSTQIISTCSSSPLPSQCPQDKSTIVGASVGATLGSAFVASLLAIWFILWRQRRHQLQAQFPISVAPQGALGPAEMDSVPGKA